MFENISREIFISVFYVREEEESEEEEEEEKVEADGKKADEGTSQDYPMARYDRNYHPCCLYMHFYNDCLCLLVSYANYKKVALLVYSVLVLKLEEWAFYFQLIALCG